MRKHSFTILIVALAALTSIAQGVHTPAKGSAERAGILDALRVPVERELKQKVVFVAENLNVAGVWAFVGGSPQQLSGGEPNYKGTPYYRAQREGMFDNNIFAILKRTGGSWRVVTYRIGCTDVCYADWWRRYKAPKSIFPYVE